MAMDEHLERWMVEADEDDRMDAVIQFEESVEIDQVEDIFEANGVTISEIVDRRAVVNVNPAGLRGIMDRDWVVSLVERPPGTGEPGHPGAALPD